jgi:hypothetical protein
VRAESASFESRSYGLFTSILTIFAISGN